MRFAEILAEPAEIGQIDWPFAHSAVSVSLIIMMRDSRARAMTKKPRAGRTPDILRKGGPMDDRTKYHRQRRLEEMQEIAEDEKERQHSDERDLHPRGPEKEK